MAVKYRGKKLARWKQITKIEILWNLQEEILSKRQA
jgi:hypothetical protein